MAGAGKRTVVVLLAFQALMVVLACVLLRYDSSVAADATLNNEDSARDTARKYPMFQGIHVMVFIGFGFLMTFLRKYGFSAVGFNFLLSAAILQWALICNGIAGLGKDHSTIPITLNSLIAADVAVAAVLISMGAVLGKTTPLQLLLMGIVETAVFAANEFFAHHKLQVTDAGDSIFVHVFGAYFGLAVSFILGKPRHSSLEGSSSTSDMFAMIGSLFLWLSWPSFNAGVLEGSSQQRAVINTYLSLAASCVTAYAFSALTSRSKKFNMVHIQNATLAGGVAIGTSANLMVQPFGAMLVGGMAGALSVIGFHYIQPKLLERVGVHDTCGVHNLHGMPGVFAALVGALLAQLASVEDYGYKLYALWPARVPRDGEGVTHAHQADPDLPPGLDRSASEQALYQLLAVAVTMVVAIITGVVTGTVLKALAPRTGKVNNDSFFDDSEHWTSEEEDDEDEDTKTHVVQDQVMDDKC